MFKLPAIIVDGHTLLREGLRQVFLSLGCARVLEASDASEARRLLLATEWSIAVLDLHLGPASGLALLRELRASGRSGPVLVYSGLPDAIAAHRVFKEGGNGYVSKCSSAAVLIQAIRRVAAGGCYVSPEYAEELAKSVATGRPPRSHDRLSNREYQVMAMMANGDTPAQIAASLGCSQNTISTYRARIQVKLGLASSLAITRYALINQILG